MGFIAGPFTALYGGATIGQTEDGFNIEWFSNEQPIIGDAFGRTPQDAVHQNIEVFVEMTLIEWNATAAQELFWPYHATLGRGPVVGSLKSTIAYKSLVMTAATGTTAAAIAGEDVWSFARVKLVENFPVRILQGPNLRSIPIRMRVYPDSSNVFFTVG